VIAGEEDRRRSAAANLVAPPGTQRIDKWLWFARIAKTRTLAAALVREGKVRVNRVRAAKASQTVREGDVLTIALRGRVEILKVRAAGERRGPPAQALLLYEKLTPASGDRGSTPATGSQRTP
jgi:ribosome-associated heat shock protein Hsp15